MRRLKLLYVTQVPPSPPRFGAQVRMHGLVTALAERHDVSAISWATPDVLDAARTAMAAYCREIALVPDRTSDTAWRKRLVQLGSLASPRTFERLLFSAPGLQREIDAALARRRFDAVVAEGPFVAHHRFGAPGDPARARVVLDEHNVEWDVRRQVGGGGGGAFRRAFAALNWRKMRREERTLWARVDGVAATSAQDAARIRAACPSARVAVVPNGVDVDRLRPDPRDPPPEPGTLLFFGALDYAPNVDGLLFFLEEVWPRLRAAHPEVRLRIVGRRPPPAVVARQGPGVEIAGFVDDVRPALARAAVVIVPLRLGGGTRLKVLEAMAMARPIVATTIGAEGLDVVDGRELLLADGAAAFAAAVVRLLAAPAEAARLGGAARALAASRYAWRASAAALERFLLEVCAPRAQPAFSRRYSYR